MYLEITTDEKRYNRLLSFFFIILCLTCPLVAGINLHESTVTATTHREGERVLASHERVLTENRASTRIWLTHYVGTESGWSIPIDFEGRALLDQIATHVTGEIWLLGRTTSNHGMSFWDRVFLIKVSAVGQVVSNLMFAIPNPARPSLSIDALGDVHLDLAQKMGNLNGYLYQIHMGADSNLTKISRQGYQASHMAHFSDQPLLALEEEIAVRSSFMPGRVVHLNALFALQEEKDGAEKIIIEQVGVPIDEEPDLPNPDPPPNP